MLDHLCWRRLLGSPFAPNIDFQLIVSLLSTLVLISTGLLGGSLPLPHHLEHPSFVLNIWRGKVSPTLLNLLVYSQTLIFNIDLKKSPSISMQLCKSVHIL